MEIIRKEMISCKFDEIKEGQCFVNSTDLVVYMRIQVVKSTGCDYAAVNLATGQICVFNPGATVVPIKATVIIE